MPSPRRSRRAPARRRSRTTRTSPRARRRARRRSGRLTLADRTFLAASVAAAVYLSLTTLGLPSRYAMTAALFGFGFALGALAMVRMLPTARWRSPIEWKARRR